MLLSLILLLLYTKSHASFKVTAAGMFIDQERPFVGALPDGIITCTCCGKGVLEVKCTFCIKDGLPQEDQENLCMTQKNGQWTLKRNHAYTTIRFKHSAMCANSPTVTLLFGRKVVLQLHWITLYETMIEDVKHIYT